MRLLFQLPLEAPACPSSACVSSGSRPLLAIVADVGSDAGTVVSTAILAALFDTNGAVRSSIARLVTPASSSSSSSSSSGSDSMGRGAPTVGPTEGRTHVPLCSVATPPLSLSDVLWAREPSSTSTPHAPGVDSEGTCAGSSVRGSSGRPSLGKAEARRAYAVLQLHVPSAGGAPRRLMKCIDAFLCDPPLPE